MVWPWLLILRSMKEADTGAWLMRVTEKRSFFYRQHLSLGASIALAMPVRAPREWRGIFYITHYCMPQLLILFMVSLFFLSAWFSDLTAFSCLLKPQGRDIQRAGRIQSSCACSYTLFLFVFVSSWKKFEGLFSAVLRDYSSCYTQGSLLTGLRWIYVVQGI